MLKSFTRNYQDESTEAGFQFIFYCDICNDGYKSSFIESTTYKKGKNLRGLTRGVGVLGDLLGGALGSIGNAVERGGYVMSDRFEDRSPEWMKEHEQAFERAQNEAMRHFHRCHSCHQYACDADYNEDEGLCVECAPRQEIYVAKARADAMRRNIDEKSYTATVWNDKIESKTTVCPTCGKPAGTGKFCNNCGASLALNKCANCGQENAQGVKFCNNCGSPMAAAGPKHCSNCGSEVAPGSKFCNECGTKV
jgi:membrane protease subunit (stomatin/prohibitin family)